ncbi:MAG: hypothetical protein AMJ46_00385 [Latescibacteria bacterium DG_63]|nr:MAG: hypothetical protein AMJ46_00385 [Latescibacteria bacterium DG_63]
MTVVALIMIGILFFIFRRSNTKSGDAYREPCVTYKLIILIGMLLCPIVVAAVRQCLTIQIVGWDLYYLLMVGFGEEIKYRGYFQSRINEEYGRPWEVCGICFGPGLIIVSILFGFSHMGQFGSFNPFEAQLKISPWMGLHAFCGSLFYGVIREKSGSVVPSSIAHGVPSAFGQTLARVLG